jgi:aminoglycoside N3'-acetyltransferase
MMAVTASDLTAAIRTLNLSDRPVCVHSSLRSFGWVEGGAATVVGALLGEGCTILVPTFSENHGTVLPPPGRTLARNAMDPDFIREGSNGSSWRFSTASVEVDADMGALPAEVLRRPGHVRGDHPRDSLTAVGPLASALIDGQRPLDIFAPFRALADHGGAVVLMGVGLDCLTLLHEAEQMAGCRLFRRWGRDSLGHIVECEEGGCSSGFENLAPLLAAFERQLRVGSSLWRVLPARETLTTAARVIRENPAITHCADPTCVRCADAIAGGPILPEDA